MFIKSKNLKNPNDIYKTFKAKIKEEINIHVQHTLRCF